MKRRELVKREPAPAAIGAPNVVSNHVAGILGKLPPGIYRSHMTVCRITIGSDGLEKSSQMVGQHCFDFESRPKGLPAAEPPPAPPEGKDGQS